MLFSSLFFPYMENKQENGAVLSKNETILLINGEKYIYKSQLIRSQWTEIPLLFFIQRIGFVVEWIDEDNCIIESPGGVLYNLNYCVSEPVGDVALGLLGEPYANCLLLPAGTYSDS